MIDVSFTTFSDKYFDSRDQDQSGACSFENESKRKSSEFHTFSSDRVGQQVRKGDTYPSFSSNLSK